MTSQTYLYYLAHTAWKSSFVDLPSLDLPVSSSSNFFAGDATFTCQQNMPVVVKPSSPRLTLEEAKAIWKRASAVCFDVDSTLIREEGLDKLAHFCGAGEEVARL